MLFGILDDTLTVKNVFVLDKLIFELKAVYTRRDISTRWDVSPD